MEWPAHPPLEGGGGVSINFAFIDSTKVTKSPRPIANIPTRIEIPMGKLKYSVANEPKPQLKHG